MFSIMGVGINDILPPFQKEFPVSKYGHGLLHGSLIESRYKQTNKMTLFTDLKYIHGKVVFMLC